MRPSALRLLPLLLLVCVGFGLLRPATAQEVDRREIGPLVIENIPPVPDALQDRLAQYQNTRAAGLADWLPDGQGLLVSTRFGETTQLHHVAVPGGARRQITFFDEPVGGASVSPDPARNGFLFGKDVGGSEFYQLFFFDRSDGSSRMLTDGTSRNGGAQWSNAGDRFVYYTTARNGQDWDLVVHDMTAGTTTPVLEEGGVWFPSDWSPDDTRLLVGRYVSANESYPYVLDLESGALVPLHTAEEPVAYGGAVFNADGTGVYYTSDEEGEFQRLRFRNLDTGQTTTLTDDIDWNVEGVELAHDGGLLAFTANEDGYSTLYLLDTETGTRTPVEGLPQGLVYSLDFSPDDTQLGFVVNGPTSPGDVYTLDLTADLTAGSTGAEAVTRWTYSETGGLDPGAFVAPDLVRYDSFDGLSVPAFVYRPQGDGPFPVVVDIHGGPEGQERPTFNALTQFLVNELGVAVIAPNVRGSDGYGKSYLLLDNGMKREDSVRDIGALLGWIAGQPALDASRVAVYGGSYGGYMVLAALTHFNDRLAAGVDVVGISNFVTFLENTQDYRRDLRRAEYGDERDPEMRAFLTAISPTTNAAKITRPLFIAQGLNDPRVPASESEQMVEVIREGGGEVWYLLARDEGHGFRKKTNRDYFTATMALFLQTHLTGEPTGEADAATPQGR